MTRPIGAGDCAESILDQGNRKPKLGQKQKPIERKAVARRGRLLRLSQASACPELRQAPPPGRRGWLIDLLLTQAGASP